MTTPNVTGLSATVSVPASRDRVSSDATEAAVNGLSARIRVGGGSSAAPLRTRSLSSVDSVDGDSAPAEVSATVNVSSKPSSSGKVSLSNSLRGTTRVKAMSAENKSVMQDLYEAIKVRCIQKGIVQPDVQEFTVGIDQKTVKYLGADGSRVQRSILADMEDDADLAREVEELINFADIHMPYNLSSRPNLKSDSKGNTTGVAPLKRDPIIQKKWYPQTMVASTKPALELLAEKHTDHQDHLSALTRMGIAETLHAPLQAKITALQQEAQTKLQEAKTANKPIAEITPLQKEVNTLNRLAARIREMDPYATAVALSFFPTQDASSEAVYKRAEEARDAVEQRYKTDYATYDRAQRDQGMWKTMKKSTWRSLTGEGSDPVHVSYHEDYARDVGGLLFAPGPEAHAEYHHYCVENSLAMKAESFDDVFFRMITRFAKDPTTDVKIALATYFEGLSTATKDAINAELDTAATKAKEIAGRASSVPATEFQAASTDGKMAQFRRHVGLSEMPPIAPWDAKLWQRKDEEIASKKAGAEAPAHIVSTATKAIAAAPGALMGAAKGTAKKVAGFFSRKQVAAPAAAASA